MSGIIIQPRPTAVVQVLKAKGDKGDKGTDGTDGTDGVDGVGVKGDKGDPGTAPITFTMDMASSTWSIVHGLTHVPVVVVYDSTGHEVVVDIDNSVLGVTTVSSYYPFAGKAIYV